MNKIRSLLLCLLGLVITQLTLADSNREHEENIAGLLEKRVVHGQAIWLNTSKQRFLGLYNEQAAEVGEGAAIILHNMGGHPDWPEVILPLRTGLPDMGWTTLSIQLPILAPGTALSDYGGTINEASQRIAAAVQHLRERKFLNIIAIGYSFGAATATEYMAANPNHRIKALVGISMQAHDFLNPRLKLLKSLETIEIPVLDIYGSRDFGEVLRLTDDRRLAGRKNSRHLYHQMQIEGADHYYSGTEEMLLRRIRGWLDKVAPGVQVIADENLQEQIDSGNVEIETNEPEN